MENHLSGLTLLVNHYLGHFALALLSLLHIQPNNLEVPIPEHVVMALVVLVLATVLALWLRSRLSVEKPGAAQQLAEFLLRNPLGVGISDILEENSGHEWQRYVPMVGSVAIFVLFCHFSLFQLARDSTSRRLGLFEIVYRRPALGARNPDLCR